MVTVTVAIPPKMIWASVLIKPPKFPFAVINTTPYVMASAVSFQSISNVGAAHSIEPNLTVSG